MERTVYGMECCALPPFRYILWHEYFVFGVQLGLRKTTKKDKKKRTVFPTFIRVHLAFNNTRVCQRPSSTPKRILKCHFSMAVFFAFGVILDYLCWLKIARSDWKNCEWQGMVHAPYRTPLGKTINGQRTKCALKSESDYSEGEWEIQLTGARGYLH